MYALGLALAAAVVVAMELPGVLRRESRREFWLFCGLTAIGFGYSLLYVLRWPVPIPTHALEAIFRPISEAIGIK